MIRSISEVVEKKFGINEWDVCEHIENYAIIGQVFVRKVFNKYHAYEWRIRRFPSFDLNITCTSNKLHIVTGFFFNEIFCVTADC